MKDLRVRNNADIFEQEKNNEQRNIKIVQFLDELVGK